MLNKILNKTALVLLSLVLLFAIARFFDVSLGGIYDDDRAPYIQVPTPHSVIIRWQTKRPNIGVVRISTRLKQTDKVFKEKNADDEHQLTLTGLEANTKYYYRVGTQKYSFYEGERYWFKTPPLPLGTDKKALPIRFWVTGDQGQAGETQTQVRDAMLSWVQMHPLVGLVNDTTALSFWLTTGDNAYRSGTNQQFQDNFFIPYQSILINTPVWPIYGNHDARRRTFRNIFSFPANGQAGGIASSSPRYYSFDYSNLHVVVLDTQSSRIQKKSKMLRWLKKDLAATTQKWIVAVFHHPPYTDGSHHSDNPADSFNRMQNVRRYVLPLLEQAGVDVVLSGHSHMYERSWFMNCHYGKSTSFSEQFIRSDKLEGELTDPKVRAAQKNRLYRKGSNRGAVYITIGSSARLDQGSLHHPAMPISLHQSGSLVFDIVGNTLTANFISQSGDIADNFTIEKKVVDETYAIPYCVR